MSFSHATSLAATNAVAPMLAAAFEPLSGGEMPIRLIAWDGSVAGRADAPVVWLHSPAALRRLVCRPSEFGVAQAYVCGEIDVDGDLAAALAQVCAQSVERRHRLSRPSPGTLALLGAVAARVGALSRPLPPLTGQARVRTRMHSSHGQSAPDGRGSENWNAFHRLILGSSMAYSCAYWAPRGFNSTLEQAQRDKLDRVCRQLGLDKRPDMWLLDLGCGRGALTLHAAEHYQAQVVAVTGSSERKAYIDAALTDKGLTDRVEIVVQDYRTFTDRPFDAATSIEMGEYVGQQHYPTFARILHDCVNPGARVLIQQMSRQGGHPGSPFVKSFIAPDMHMHPLAQSIGLLEEAGLLAIRVKTMGAHYLRTVDAWIDNLETHWNTAVALIGEEDARVWRLYLAGGRLAFTHGQMGVDQILLARPSTVAGNAVW